MKMSTASVLYAVVGYLVQEKPGLGVPVMQQWLGDDNMWLRRTALLHQVYTAN